MLVSVVIPALNEVNNIERAVQGAAQSYGHEQVEIIVVDGGSDDGTAARVPHPARTICAPRGRAVQMNRGASESCGQVLVFCHADSILPQGWREAVIEALEPPCVSGGTFQTRILPASGFLRWRNHWRFPANWRIMFGDQVQFMRRETFERIGGFQEIPLMEDVEMSRALHQTGRVVRIPSRYRVITSSRRFADVGVLRQILRNGWNMLRYLHLGATPEQISGSYRSNREQD